MLINTTKINSSDWSKELISSAIEKYGTILDLPLPEDYLNLEETATNYFFRISANFDTCANTPKDNIVIIDLGSPLKKEIIKLLEMSKIETISKKTLFLKLY
jgi:hypothetical protein